MKQLNDIIRRLRIEDERWDAILDLKMSSGTEWVDALVELLQDPDWVVRWCVAEKLGDIGDTRALEPLFERLIDNDFHVRKNTMKAIEKFESKMVSMAVNYLNHSHVMVRTHVQEILENIGEPVIPALRKVLVRDEWAVSNRILYIIFKINKDQSLPILKDALSIPYVQKNAIVLIGQLQDASIVPDLIRLYEKPALRRLILHSIKLIGKRSTFPLIVRALNHPAVCDQAAKMIVKIGTAILPNLIVSLTKPGFSKAHLIKLICRIGPKKAMEKLYILADKDAEIEQLIQPLKSKYPRENTVTDEDSKKTLLSQWIGL